MRRLALSLLLVVLAATMGAGWALDRLFAEVGRIDERDDAAPFANWRALGRQLADVVALVPGGEMALDNGYSLLSRDDLPLDGVGAETLERELASPAGLALESDSGITVYHALSGGDRILALDYRLAREPAIALRWVLTLAFYLLLLLLVLAWLLPLLRRLERLTNAASAFGNGDLDRRVDTGPRSKLHGLEAAFNAMASRIESLVEDNRLLSSGVSHDLRTPLARLRFGLDSLHELRPDAPDIDRHRASHMARLDADVETMESLLTVMLDYARFDAKLDRAPRESVDLGVLVTACVEQIEASSETASLESRVGGGIEPIEGHRAQLMMLVDNLLQNARRYGRGRVLATVTAAAPGVLDLIVEDDGDGIPAAERDRVLRPFARGDGVPPSQAAEGGELSRGHGLGLALVVRIAAWHHGELTIDASRELGGAAVRVRFAKPRTSRADRAGRVHGQTGEPVDGQVDGGADSGVDGRKR